MTRIAFSFDQWHGCAHNVCQSLFINVVTSQVTDSTLDEETGWRRLKDGLDLRGWNFAGTNTSEDHKLCGGWGTYQDRQRGTPTLASWFPLFPWAGHTWDILSTPPTLTAVSRKHSHWPMRASNTRQMTEMVAGVQNDSPNTEKTEKNHNSHLQVSGMSLCKTEIKCILHCHGELKQDPWMEATEKQMPSQCNNECPTLEQVPLAAVGSWPSEGDMQMTGLWKPEPRQMGKVSEVLPGAL